MTEQSFAWGQYLELTSYDTGTYYWKLVLLFLTWLAFSFTVLVSSRAQVSTAEH
jgi:hypothetical protein